MINNSQLTMANKKTAFDDYIRNGNESFIDIGDDGVLAPDELCNEINRRLKINSPIRSIADIRTTSSKRKIVQMKQLDDSSFSSLTFPTMDFYAMPAATSALLEDSEVDIDAWIASEVETAFAEQESAAFINGDGTNKPKGFLTETTVDEDSWTWGNIGTISTGVDGDFDDSDVLVDTVYALKAGYRQNANWVMNRKTQAEVRKLKDTDGNYLWQPPAAPDEKATLMGFDIIEAEDMPDIDTGSNSIAFGDFKRGYLIYDRMGVRILRDPYSAKPYVLFYTTKCVGGGVQDFDAIKLIKFGA